MDGVRQRAQNCETVGGIDSKAGGGGPTFFSIGAQSRCTTSQSPARAKLRAPPADAWRKKGDATKSKAAPPEKKEKFFDTSLLAGANDRAFHRFEFS